jgi:hypothetical protein
MKKLLKLLLYSAFISLIISSSSHIASPIAVATSSPDTLVTIGTSNSVTLSGSSSTGSSLAYVWTKTSGPTGNTIVSPTSSSTSVIGLSITGIYKFLLTVTDINSLTASTTITITVLPQGTSIFNDRGILLYESSSFIRVSYNAKIAKNNKGQVLGYYDYSLGNFIPSTGVYSSFLSSLK